MYFRSAIRWSCAHVICDDIIIIFGIQNCLVADSNNSEIKRYVHAVSCIGGANAKGNNIMFLSTVIPPLLQPHAILYVVLYY